MGTVTLKHDVTNETVADPSLDGDIMDNGMDETSPDVNKGTNPSIVVGKTDVKTTNQIAICHYDMAQVVPKDATITDADWWIYLEAHTTVVLSITYRAYRIRRHDWVESECSWNDANSGTPWTTPGALHGGNDYDGAVLDDLTGLALGASGTNTGATDTTLTHIGAGWTPGAWEGFTVLCNSKSMLITGNTDEILTGTGWSGGGNPGSPYSYVIMMVGFLWNPSLINIVQDAQNNQNGQVHFKVIRTDDLSITSWFQYATKEVITGDYKRPHLRVTYELDSKTFQANVY